MKKFFFDLLNLNKHFSKNFTSATFLKNLLLNQCLILLFTICGTFFPCINSASKTPKQLYAEQQVPHFYPVYDTISICLSHSLCMWPSQRLMKKQLETAVSAFPNSIPWSLNVSNYHNMLAAEHNLQSKPEGLNSHWRWWVFQCAGDILVPLHYYRTPYLVTITQLLKGNNILFVNTTLLLEWFS